jgi:diguanylate cyclase
MLTHASTRFRAEPGSHRWGAQSTVSSRIIGLISDQIVAAALLPEYELARLAALKRLNALDSAPEEPFDTLVSAAAAVTHSPIALLSLVDSERQWFKAAIGLTGISETARELAFCAYTILQDDVFEIQDATEDHRFADHPWVTGPPHIRFYAGATLRVESGARVGSLCVIDHSPRRLSIEQRLSPSPIGPVRRTRSRDSARLRTLRIALYSPSSRSPCS